jgi:hypothetical protein
MDISGDSGGPLPTNPNSPKWKQAIVKIAAGVSIGTGVVCGELGFDECKSVLQSLGGALRGYSGNNVPQNSPGSRSNSGATYTAVYNFNGGSSIASRVSAVNKFNSTAASNAGRLYVTPSGAVVTWGGQLVTGPVTSIK